MSTVADSTAVSLIRNRAVLCKVHIRAACCPALLYLFLQACLFSAGASSPQLFSVSGLRGLRLEAGHGPLVIPLTAIFFSPSLAVMRCQSQAELLDQSAKGSGLG